MNESAGAVQPFDDVAMHLNPAKSALHRPTLAGVSPSPKYRRIWRLPREKTALWLGQAPVDRKAETTGDR